MFLQTSEFAVVDSILFGFLSDKSSTLNMVGQFFFWSQICMGHRHARPFTNSSGLLRTLVFFPQHIAEKSIKSSNFLREYFKECYEIPQPNYPQGIFVMQFRSHSSVLVSNSSLFLTSLGVSFRRDPNTSKAHRRQQRKQERRLRKAERASDTSPGDAAAPELGQKAVRQSVKYGYSRSSVTG